MQSVAVDFGRAIFSHRTAKLELQARATARLQTACPHLRQRVSLDAATILLQDLWVRPQRPIRFLFTLTKGVYRACLPQDEAESNEELLSILSSAMFWSQLGFEVVNAACARASASVVTSETSTEFHIDLDRAMTWSSSTQLHVSDPTDHDPNDINCPDSIPTAKLTDVKLELAFQGFSDHIRYSSQPPLAAIVDLVDIALRDLICYSPPRLAAGIGRSFPYISNLQNIFPAIFYPARPKAVADRLQLISSIAGSIVNCSDRFIGSSSTSSGFDVMEDRQSTSCTEKSRQRQLATAENSLFMCLVYNTTNPRGTKALKPLSTESSRQPASQRSSDLPTITWSLSLFDPPADGARKSSVSLFFEDSDGSEQDKKRAKYPNSLNGAFEVTTKVADELSETFRATNQFEDLTRTQPFNGTHMEDCNPGDLLASRRYSEPGEFSSLSHCALPRPISELDDDLLLIRERVSLHEEAAPPRSLNSATTDVIGENRGLTHCSIHSGQPDDWLRDISLHEQPHVLTAPAEDQDDKTSIYSFPEDLFALKSLEHSTYSTTVTTQFDPGFLELLVESSPVPPSDDFEIFCLSQESGLTMNSSRDGEPSLAELLGEDKFMREMWNRRRSTVMDSNPSTYEPSSPARTLGSGWRLKTPPKEIKQMPVGTNTTLSRDSRRRQADDKRYKPTFSKRSSVSSSSSASLSPTESTRQRRDSFLSHWSRALKTSRDQDMPDLDLGRTDKRTVEVKRRKTLEDYEMRDAIEDDDDMLFA